MSLAQHKSAEIRQAEILDAALTCFGRHGYHETRIDDIAAGAGLSKGAVYHQFASKEAVFFAVFDRFDAEFDLLLSTADGRGPHDVLEAYGHTVVTTLCGRNELASAWSEFFSHVGARARLAETYAKARTALAEIFAEIGVAKPEFHAAGFVATLEGLVLQCLCDSTFDAPAVWQEIGQSWLGNQGRS